jgi:hypothetical protein
MKKYVRLFLFCAAALLLTRSVPALAQDALKKWETFDFAKQRITAAQLNRLELEDLQKLRGIVFGKHGRVFKEKSIQDYLEKRAWYKPNPGFRNAKLTAVERQNLDSIRLAEAAKHDWVEPGDLRLWQKKTIPEDKIYAKTAAEWRVLIAEVEAIHGKTFPEEPWLQQYFEERYWYKANPNYSPAALTDIERANIEAFKKKRDAERRVAVSPGDMDKFQNVVLTEEMLAGATLNELRSMRNEFWARRGRKFSAAAIQQEYEWQDWYRAARDQKTVKLSAIEQQNADTLLRVENRLRESIALKPVAVEELSGLYIEDLRVLRNEIYARRGRVFKSKDLNEYFIAQPWYKPDPNYSDAALTDIEKANLKVIADAEKDAFSKFVLVEG